MEFVVQACMEQGNGAYVSASFTYAADLYTRLTHDPAFQSGSITLNRERDGQIESIVLHMMQKGATA